MGFYKKRPTVVEAFQFDGTLDNAESIIRWITDHDGQASTHDVYDVAAVGGPPRYLVGGIHIDTLEGLMNASSGDMIIRGVNGEFYPCKPDIFAKTYEEGEA